MDFNNAKDTALSLFEQSLCKDEGFTLQPHGYFSACFMNTYMLALPQLLLLLYTAPKISFNEQNGKQHTALKNFKFLMTIIQVVATVKFGPVIFNVISLTVSFVWLFLSFLFTFAELKGFQIPRKSLLGYYFICSLIYGYYFLSLVAQRVWLPTDERAKASVALCIISFINAALRDIGDSIEQIH